MKIVLRSHYGMVKEFFADDIDLFLNRLAKWLLKNPYGFFVEKENFTNKTFINIPAHSDVDKICAGVRKYLKDMLEGKFKYWKKRNGFYGSFQKKDRDPKANPDYEIVIDSDVISNRNKVNNLIESELGVYYGSFFNKIESREMRYISSILKLWLREYWFHKSERFKQFKDDMKMKVIEERLSNIQNGLYAQIFETLNLKIWNK